MQVTNCEPTKAPNPKCCSNPRVLCVRCATEVLRSGAYTNPYAGVTGNHASNRWADDDTVDFDMDDDDDDMLPLPTQNELLEGYDSDPADNDDDDDDTLAIPGMQDLVPSKKGKR